MSVFFRNICEFNSCRRNFYTLRDLIVHIENDHLDFHPDKVEKLEEEKPDSLPLSYVLKFSDASEQVAASQLEIDEAVTRESTDVQTPDELVTSLNNNYLGCETREKRCPKSVEARATREEVTRRVLGFERREEASWGTLPFDCCRSHRLFTLDNNQKKPFACNMPGCEKRYKNVNGIKYHYKNHHKIHTPSVKKSLLKYKPVRSNGKSRQGAPFPTFRTQSGKEGVRRNAEVEGFPNDYFYKVNMVPTSNDFHVSHQVPLPNISFNNNYYYNVNDMSGDMEEFACKNSINFFVSNLD